MAQQERIERVAWEFGRLLMRAPQADRVLAMRMLHAFEEGPVAAPAQGQQARTTAATAGGPKGTTTKRRRRNRNVTRWTLDNQARRPPTWLIEATGLDTKTKLAQRYGIGAKFAMGAPLPKPITVPKAALRAPLKAAARTAAKRPQARPAQRYAAAQQAAVH